MSSAATNAGTTMAVILTSATDLLNHLASRLGMENGVIPKGPAPKTEKAEQERGARMALINLQRVVEREAAKSNDFDPDEVRLWSNYAVGSVDKALGNVCPIQIGLTLALNAAVESFSDAQNSAGEVEQDPPSKLNWHCGFCGPECLCAGIPE